MLGADGPTRYMLAFQNLSAPRGTGGYLGFIGVLEAEDGQLTLASLDPVGDVPVVAAGAGAAGRRAPVRAVRGPHDDVGVELPARRADVLADRDADRGGRRGWAPVDGVIWADTVWMADMLGAIGPVSSTAWPEPVTPENLVEVFNRRLFESPDQATINDAPGAARPRPLERAAHPVAPSRRRSRPRCRPGPVAATSPCIATDGDAQETLERLGAAGVFEPGENPLAVVWQDASANRAGYFAEHAVGSKVTLGGDGSARGPHDGDDAERGAGGPPSELLGDGRGVPVGSWGVDVEVYMPVGAIDPQVTVSGPSVSDMDEAYGHPVADAYLFADPGGGPAATVTYRLDAAATEADGHLDLPDPGHAPAHRCGRSRTPWRSRCPREPSVEHVSDGFVAQGNTVRWEGSPTEPTGTGRELRALTGQRPVDAGRPGLPFGDSPGPATDSRPPSACTMSATACARRLPCSFEVRCTPRSSSTAKKSSRIARWSPSSEASETFSARASRARVWIDGSTWPFSYLREPRLGDAGDLLELGLAEAGGEPGLAQTVAEVLSVVVVVHATVPLRSRPCCSPRAHRTQNATTRLLPA